MQQTPMPMPVQLEIRADRIAVVTLDRPHVINALDQAAVRRLRALVRDLDADPGVDVVVLTGAGERGFCVGADLKERQTMANEAARAYVQAEVLPLFREFDARTKPAVAAVFGHTMGAGFELTLCCDLVVAADDTVFALPEVKWGIIPAAAGCRKLPGRIGAARARAMILAGERLPAAQAQALGLTNAVVARSALLDEALALAARVAAGVPQAVQAARRCIEDAVAAPAAHAFDLQTALACYTEGDPHRHLAAFGRR